MATIHYSDGHQVECHIEIWDDLNEERAGYFRAFWADGGGCGSPVIGYCSPGGSHRTVKACVAEVARLCPGEAIYRNGREVRP